MSDRCMVFRSNEECIMGIQVASSERDVVLRKHCITLKFSVLVTSRKDMPDTLGLQVNK